MDEKQRFTTLLDNAHQELIARLLGTEDQEAGVLVALLFEAGHAIGLSDREITQAILRPVKTTLRPGLARP